MDVFDPPLRVSVMDGHYRAFLRGGGGVVHSVFPRAVNILGEDGLVCAVCGGRPAPYSAIVAAAEAPFAGVVAGDAVTAARDGMVSVGGRVRLDHSRARLFQAAFRRPGGCPETARGLAAFDEYCAAGAPDDGCAGFFRRHFLGAPGGAVDGMSAGLSARLADFTSAVRERGAFERALWRLIGAGPGLTPSGDDFVCGFLFALHNSGGAAADALLSRMARVLSGRTLPTTDVAVRMIRAYLDGESADVFRGLLEAFCGCRDMRTAMADARSVGHSSGMDFAVGVATAFRIVPR